MNNSVDKGFSVIELFFFSVPVLELRKKKAYDRMYLRRNMLITSSS